MPALVIEGGGMRAAYANGVLAAFEEHGFTDFDAVYGTSAGGALAAWFSAGQARHASKTWHYAGDERILSYKRWLLRKGPLLDHDGLFEIVYKDEMPLDVEAVQAASHPVIVTATDVETGEPRYVDLRDGNVFDWLRATGRLPLASGPPVVVDGRAYLDGGLAVPVPIQRAFEDGHDEIVLLLNRPERKSEAKAWLLSRVISRRYPGLEDLVRRHAELWNEQVALARDPPAGVSVDILQPAEYLDLARLSRDAEDIDRALSKGVSDGRAYVGDRMPALPGEDVGNPAVATEG